MKVLNLFFYVFLWIAVGAVEPQVVYLTWTDDPTTTMTIQWHMAAGAAQPQLNYRDVRGAEWRSIEGESITVEGTDVDVHTIHLEGLTENSDYVFKLQGAKREYKFRTMPKTLIRPVRMAIGGDAFYIQATELFHRMNRMIAFEDPDFIVVGGDLAYTKGSKQTVKGRKWEMSRWQGFLRGLQRANMGKDGRLVPMLPIVGNHDVDKPHRKTHHPEMFYEIFTFPHPQKAYRSLDFGDYLNLILLDSGHTSPIEGEQTVWLEKRLKQNSMYTLAAYHVAAYPSHYPYAGEVPEKLRKYWVPLFEKYQLPFAFEHHNHTYKRTHPIKNGKVDPGGVTYLGDGTWGVVPRIVKSPKELWYLMKSKSINACYIVTLTEEKCLIEAKNIQGEVIDQVEFSNHLQLQY